MANPKLIYVPSGTEELKQQFLRDYRLGAIDGGSVSDLSVSPGSDADLLGTAIANLAMLSVRNAALAAADSSILDAEGDALDRKRVEDGLPEVPASAATGKIKLDVLGSTTIVEGTQFIYPNGVRGEVVGTWINPSDGSEVDGRSLSTGESSNLASGEVVRFVAPPVNLGTDATVSSSEPFTGGTDSESDQRKRERILNKRRNLPAGGNWAYQRQLVLDNLGGIQDAYSYPALGGPSSAKIVPTKDFDDDLRNWSRSPSSASLDRVRQLLWSENSLNDDTVVNGPSDEEVDFTLLVTIPESAKNGGNGLGWTDATVWPQLEAGDNSKVTVTAYSGLDITVSAQTATSPVAGQTTISWWAPADKRFYSALATAVSGASGAWVLTLEKPLSDLDGNTPQVGDYVSPSALTIDGYASSWVDLFRELGPGENTADADRLPRALRHPFPADERPHTINSITLLSFTSNHHEISDIAFGHAPQSSPTVPASADDAPNVLTPGRFAIYKK